ncbi:MAG: EamA family transporter [Labilithrix sp.]
MNAALPLGETRARLDPRVLLALLVVYMVWGSTYLAARVAVSALPAWGLAGTRYLLAGLVALAVARLRGERLPSRRDWLLAIPAGLGLFFIGNGFIVVAVKTLPSGVAAVAAATTPLIAMAINAFRGERPARTEVAGMVLGFTGVFVLMGASAVAGWPALCLVVAPFGFAVGSLIVRALGKGGSPLAVAGPQMITGGAAMLILSFALGEPWPSAVPWRAAGAWLYLVVFGSLVGFTVYAWLLRHARPAISMSYAYVNPIVAVLLGAVLGGERLGFTSAISAVLIASGVMLAVRGKSQVTIRPSVAK